MSEGDEDVRIELPIFTRANIDRDRLFEIERQLDAYTNYVIVVPEGVAKIEKRDFEGILWNHQWTGVIPHLKFQVVAIELPDSLTEIPSELFQHCATLTRVIIGKGVAKIGSDAFVGCKGLKTVIMRAGDNRLEIDTGAFGHCPSLESIEFPDNLSRLGDYSFVYCEKLTSVTIPKHVERIGEGAFVQCTGLETVTIISDADIPYNCFKGCSSLTNVNFMSEKIPSLGSGAFEECTSLVVDQDWADRFTTVADDAFVHVPPFPLILKDLGGNEWEVTNWNIPWLSARDILKGKDDIVKHVKTCAMTQHKKTLGASSWSLHGLVNPTKDPRNTLIVALLLFESGKWDGETELTNEWFIRWGGDETDESDEDDYTGMADEVIPGDKRKRNIGDDGGGRASKKGLSFTDLAI